MCTYSTHSHLSFLSVASAISVMDSEDVLLANTVELQEGFLCTKLHQHTNHGRVRVTHHTDMQLYHMLSSHTHIPAPMQTNTHAACTLIHTHIRTYIVCVCTCTKAHILYVPECTYTQIQTLRTIPPTHTPSYYM